MKRTTKLAAALLATTLALTACSSVGAAGDGASDADAAYPGGEPVRFIIPFAPGGGTDLAARALQPYLEDELGVPVVVENVTGGSGWVAWGELAQAEPDGHTLAYAVYPNVFTGYINPSANRTETLESFTPIISHHADTGIVVVRGDDDRFPDIESFVEFAQQNELTANSGGVGSSPHFAGVQFNDQLDTNLRFVHSDGGSEQLTQLLGSHIDVAFLDYAVAQEFIANGDVRVIGVLGDEPNGMVPDAPVVNEVMDSDIQRLLSRGILGPAGMEQETVDTLIAAIESALADPEHQQMIQDLGMEVDGAHGAEYLEALQTQEQSMRDVADLFGW